MNLSYTDSFSLTTTEKLIQKGDTPGDGVIPNSISVRAISVVPTKSTTFPAYWVKGIHTSSDWVKIDGDTPIYSISGLSDGTNLYFYIKSDSGSITMNLHVKGQI